MVNSPIAEKENAVFATTFNDSVDASIWKNGGLTQTIPHSLSIDTHNTLQLGHSTCKVCISETIQYSRILSNTEIGSVNNYLKQKWGL